MSGKKEYVLIQKRADHQTAGMIMGIAVILWFG